MSQRRAKRPSPANSTDAITNRLKNKWLRDVTDTAVNGTVDTVAAILAAEILKLSLIEIMERGLAPQGPEAIRLFHFEIAEALERIQPLRVEGGT